MNTGMLITFFIAFFIALLIGALLLPVLRILKFGQHIREEEPANHQRKSGTPILGGLIFILSTALTMLFIDKGFKSEGMIVLFSFMAFGGIGFLDDSLKLFRKNNLGLRSHQKMILLIILSAILVYYICPYLKIDRSLIIPFSKKTIDIGIWYFPFIIFYFAATTNGANLTDGLDGLAGTIGLLLLVFFSVLSFTLGRYSLALFCTAASGSILGFLRYNTFPAKVFMGDTGALAIGGAVATTAMILKLPLLILIIGGIYVAEVLSDVIQICYFKLYRKRVFKMAPIHYHFELSGWHETKVVSVFSIITAILCFIGFLSIS